MFKGQIVTLDFMFALSIAVALVFVINTQWVILYNNIETYENSVPIGMAAHQSSMHLLNGRGYPSDWNSTNVRLIGLIDDKITVIDQHKLDELAKIDNNSLGELLGVPGYNVFINITTVIGETTFSTGLRPENFTIFSRVANYASYNRVLSKLYLTVWQ